MSYFRKLLKTSVKSRKGIAIIAALFASAIVLILGVSFLMLAFKESDSTKADNESTLALQMAHAGVELTLNYMSVVGNWEYDPSYSVRLMEYATTPNPHKSESILNESFKFQVQREVLADRIQYTIYITPDRAIGQGDFYEGNIVVSMEQAVFTSGQPPHYIISSMGSVYRKGKNKPSASRVVQCRFREKTALDNLLFVQNMRAWDLVGNGVTPPNAEDGSNNSVGIPSNYTANGPVTIDGSSDFANETAGNLNFFSTDNVHFYGQTSINQSENLFPDGTDQETQEGIFAGGLSTNQASVGLPERASYMSTDYNGNGSISSSEKGNAVRLAEDYSGQNAAGQNYVKAYYSCGDNDGLSTPSNTIGHCKCTDPEAMPKWQGQWGIDPSNQYDNMSRDVPADVEFDGDMVNSKPGFAKFTVEFNANGTLTLSKTTAYTNVTTVLLNNASLDRFKNGMLYIEGGNVEVKNAENNGGVNGQLTVVSAESAKREAYAYSVTTSDNQTITQYSTKERNQEVYPNNPEYWVPGKIVGKEVSSVKQLFSSSSIYVPYDDSRLPIRVDAAGNLTGNFDRVPPYKVGGKWVWPGESTILNTIKNSATTDGSVIGLYNDIEREGNLTIGGELTYKGSSSLGLIAKNYILLNDDNVSASGSSLTVNAVLMSFDHSLQFDDVNMSGKDDWISQPGMNGKFNFMGSNISAFADVEGKIDGTGYTTQTLMYDQNLKYTLPPNFPRWDLTQLDPSVVIDFVILSYQDKGAINTY